LILHEQIAESVAAIRALCGVKPRVGLVLGTGLGAVTDGMVVEGRIPYEQIPHFPVSTVDTHAGELFLGRVSGRPALVMSGRFHYYEGYTMQQVVYPVRVARALGVEVLVVSNAAGGINEELHTGDLMLIRDHINLMGDNPLIGPNDDTLGPRFPDMSAAYSPRLQEMARTVAANAGIVLREGVYAAVAGPNLETAAEYRFLRTIGADAVGMSTVPEVIAAVHCGMRVAGFSVITDECVPERLAVAEVDKIIAAANAAAPRLVRLVDGLVGTL